MNEYVDEKVERQVIWQIVENPKKRQQIFTELNPEWLTSEELRAIFRAGFDLFMKNEDFKMPEIEAELKDEYSIMGLLSESDSSFGSPTTLIKRLGYLYKRRKVSEEISDAWDAVPEENPEDIARKLSTNLIRSIGDMVAGEERTPDELIDSALKRYDSDEEHGAKTGINVIDKWVHGVMPGRLYLIAATKKTGKTRLLTSMLYNMAKDGHKTTFLSLEMRDDEIVDLINAKHCTINSGLIVDKNLGPIEKNKIAGSVNEVRDILGNLRICNPAVVTKDGLEAMIRFHHSYHGSKIFGIDFLTKIMVDRKAENTEYGDLCMMLSALARELDISIILICQLNKKAEDVKDPNMGHIEGTGRIAQFADVMFLLAKNKKTSFYEQQGVQALKLCITQRQGESSDWIPLNTKLQFLDFNCTLTG